MGDNGKLLVEEDQILQRWKEHFEEVLNIENQCNENEAEDDFHLKNIEIVEEINTGPFYRSRGEAGSRKVEEW